MPSPKPLIERIRALLEEERARVMPGKYYRVDGRPVRLKYDNTGEER